MVERMRVRNIGPVEKADIRFGDLTVFVGPQATGKSIVLQMLKLAIDKAAIHATMRNYGLAWRGDLDAFLERYLGEGMSSVWNRKSSRLSPDGARKKTGLAAYAKESRREPPDSAEKMFYIPAQRVTSLRDGMTRPFSDYRAGDPFVLRDFSQNIHEIVQNEIGPDSVVFPREQFFSRPLRQPLEEHILASAKLRTDSTLGQNRLVLQRESGPPLSYLAWSAGQREFMPLLLGLYWLMPASKASRRQNLEWAVIEEPEMGLHPNATGAVMNLVMALLQRGYRVCLSTHSPHVLDIVWALRFIQENKGTTGDVRALFGLKGTVGTGPLVKAALKSELKTYYFPRDGEVRDISGLDPGSDDRGEWGWGGLTEFSSHVGDVVADVAARAETGGR